MADKKQLAQTYCDIAAKLEVANLVTKKAKETESKLYLELENLRNGMGEGLEDYENLVILLTDNKAVVVSKRGSHTHVDIGRTV